MINYYPSLFILVSINEYPISKPLAIDVSNGFIVNINLNIKRTQVDFLSIIKSKAKLLTSNHKDNIIFFVDLLKDKTPCVLAVKILKSHLKDSLEGLILSHVTVNNLVIINSGEKQILIQGNFV